MNVLVIDAFQQSFIDALSQLPVSVNYLPDSTAEEVLRYLPGSEILILNSKIRLRREIIDLAPKLCLVVRAGVGMDHIDVDYLEQKGVQVRNTKGGNADSVGEHTVGMMLSLTHNLHRADRQVRQFQWKREENRGSELSRKTVGIIGYGNTGTAVARRLSSFGCRVMAYDKYKFGFGNDQVEEVALEALFEQADILTLHVPLTHETRQWVDTEFINQFEKPFMLLNLARGPIVDLMALIQGLDKRQVTGAALDVLENENFDALAEFQKTTYQNLFNRGNVIFTPHIGGWSFESLENISQMILEHVKELLD